MTAAQVREIGVAADAFAEGPDDSPVFGNRYADLTTRQDIQLHWIRIADVPRIWQRFWEVGLTTVQACGDSARNVCSCPVSGIDAGRRWSRRFPWRRRSPLSSRAIASTPTCRASSRSPSRGARRTVPGSRSTTSVCGRREHGGRQRRLQRAHRRRACRTASVWRRTSTSSFGPTRRVELCRGVAQVFGELGNRENRGLARMRYLAQELGPEGFRAALEERTQVRARAGGPRADHGLPGRPRRRPPPKAGPGSFYVGCSVPVGRMHGIDLVELARLAETYGDGGVRIGIDQNFILSGVARGPPRRPAGRDADADLLALPRARSSGAWSACTGSEFCRFAVVETKERAVEVGADARRAALRGRERQQATALA